SPDGGGIRGVSELIVLHEIMVRVQDKKNLSDLPKPCEYFHLIGGTSTGGLIAIMLGRLEMSTEDALKQ
ncbi:FabD/lysophospholipase-like protein, partial [Dendrothele bispora CBS 962.96]